MNDSFLEKVFGIIPTPSIILKTDAPKFTIAFVNEAYENLSRKNKKSLIGKGFFEAFPKMETVKVIQKTLIDTIHSKQKTVSPVLKYWIPEHSSNKDKLKYFNTQNSPIFNNEMEVEYILRSVNDITDTVVLGQNEIILGNAGVDFWEYNPDSELISWLDNSLELSLNERKNTDSLIKVELSKFLKDYQNKICGKYFSFESTLKCEDEGIKYFKVSAKIIFNNLDKPVTITGAIMEIKTEVDNQSTEFLNKIINEEENKRFLFELDLNGNFLSAQSPFLYEFIDIKEDKLKEFNICELLHCDYKIPFLKLLEKLIANSNNKYQINLDFVNNTEELASYLLELTFVPQMLNNNSKIICNAYFLNKFVNIKNPKHSLKKGTLNSFSNSDFLILDWDIRSDEVQWFPDFFEFFGFDNKSYFNIDTWDGFVNKFDSERLRKSLSESIKDKSQSRWFASYQLKMPDSSFAFVEFEGFIVRDKDNTAIKLIGSLKDISKQKLNETHLKLLESFIQNTNDAVMISEPDTTDLNRQRIIYVNESFVKMTGYSSEETLGRNPRFLKGLDPNSPTYDSVYNTIRQRKYLKVELPYKKRNGITGWVSMSMHPIFNDSGIFINWVSIAHDITEKKISQINLSYKSKLIETIASVNSSLLQHSKYLEVMDNSFKVVGQAAKVDKVYYFELIKSENKRQSFHKKLQWSSRDFVPAFKEEVYPRSLLKQFLPELLLNKHFSGITNELEDSPFKILLSSLEVKSFLLFPLFVQNNLYGIIGFDDCKEERIWNEDEISFLKTISLNFAATIERQISNEILKIAYKEKEDTIESLQDGFFSISHDGIVTFWNEEAEKIANMKKENVLGKNFLSIFSEKLSENILSYYNKSWIGLEPLRIEEYFQNIDKWLELSVFPTQAGISGYFKDVTHRKLGEKKLTDLHKKLKTNLKELSVTNIQLEQFAYIASHDLQEPLRMITSFLTLLEKKYSSIIDEKGKQYIYHAVDGAKRMRQIILDLLEFSRVGHQEGNKEKINLNELINEVQILYSNRITDTSAKFELQKLPVIKSYPAAIKQIFQNLISNSLKYKDQERPCEIAIRYKTSNDFYVFEVADNGLGISEEYYDKIFVIFQRLHNNKSYTGTGLGLAITKKIVESLGGNIWVKSIEGKGSNFYFTLPKL